MDHTGSSLVTHLPDQQLLSVDYTANVKEAFVYCFLPDCCWVYLCLVGLVWFDFLVVKVRGREYGYWGNTLRYGNGMNGTCWILSSHIR